MIWRRARSAASSAAVVLQGEERKAARASLAWEAAQEHSACVPKSSRTSETILPRKPVQQIRMVSQYGEADLHKIADFCDGAVLLYKLVSSFYYILTMTFKPTAATANTKSMIISFYVSLVASSEAKGHFLLLALHLQFTLHWADRVALTSLQGTRIYTQSCFL